MRRPNYRFERAERARIKQAKKEEKVKRQQERIAGEKPAESGPAPVSAVNDDMSDST